MKLPEKLTRYLFFTGKGGVGKTSISCATAIGLADQGRKVLLVSTDPASNLDEVLGVRLGTAPTSVPEVPGLEAMNLDPELAAAEYRNKMVGPYRGVLPEATVRSMEEQLSGSCTMAMASSALLGGSFAPLGGQNLIEAMACGCPVVSTRSGGNSDIIRHGVNGFLFHEKNSREAVRYIEALTTNPALRHRIIRQARRKVAAENNEDVVIDRFLKICDGLSDSMIWDESPGISHSECVTGPERIGEEDAVHSAGLQD